MSASAAELRDAATRFLHHDEDDDACFMLCDDDIDDEDRADINYLSLQSAVPAVVVIPDEQVAAESGAPKTRSTRITYPRRDQKHSLWWLEYLTPASRQDLILHPEDGRMSKRFHRFY